MAIALTDLGTKVVFIALLWSKCSYPFYSCSYSALLFDWRSLLQVCNSFGLRFSPLCKIHTLMKFVSYPKKESERHDIITM